MTPTRVLVVDDSAFTRKVLREILQGEPGIEVVGTARDGLDALSKIEELDPDVVTLDLVMPNLDGIETLRALGGRQRPAVVVVCMAEAGSDLALEALDAGAVDVVHKPTALATQRLYDLSKELVFKVASASLARKREVPQFVSSFEGPRLYRHSRDIVVIGGSTGGPHAIETIIKKLPADFPVPIAVVVHLPIGFTAGYAERLNAECALQVHEATDKSRLVAGEVTIARAGVHLNIVREGNELLTSLQSEPRSLHRPSVDELFSSAAAAAGARALGVVLTGMGDDGLVGSRALRGANSTVLVEAEASCVVYGMPRVVFQAGLANEQHLLQDMAQALLRLV